MPNERLRNHIHIALSYLWVRLGLDQLQTLFNRVVAELRQLGLITDVFHVLASAD